MSGIGQVAAPSATGGWCQWPDVAPLLERLKAAEAEAASWKRTSERLSHQMVLARRGLSFGIPDDKILEAKRILNSDFPDKGTP